MAESRLLDRAVGSDITVSASYLDSRGTHLPTFVDTNLSPANSTVEYLVGGQSRGTFPFFRGTRPDPNINNAIEVADIVESTYNALVLQANKRFSKGLLFNVNYTLSKAEDTGQNSTTFISNFATMVDPFNNEDEKGPASFDRRHRGVVSVHYAPDYLHGFQIGGTGTFESGLPLNPDQRRRGGGDRTDQHHDHQRYRASNRPPFEGRNSFRQTGRKTIDMRISKRFNVGGRRQIEALWEAFNILNTINYTSFGTTHYRVASSSYDASRPTRPPSISPKTPALPCRVRPVTHCSGLATCRSASGSSGKRSRSRLSKKKGRLAICRAAFSFSRWRNATGVYRSVS